eukprot:12345845-Alexandrium_andersonii.AAC.1
MQEAPCEAWRLLHLDLWNGGLRRSPIPSREEGRLARWACRDCGPGGLDLGPKTHFDQKIKRP